MMADNAGQASMRSHLSVHTRIDLACDRFEAAWKTGAEHRISAFLDGWQEPARLSLLQELVSLDLEYRWRHVANGPVIDRNVPTDIGKGLKSSLSDSLDFPTLPLLEDYVRKFPELGPVDRLPDELIAQEYEVRLRWGQRPSRREYLERFGADALQLFAYLSEVETVQSHHDTPASTKDAKRTRTSPLATAGRACCPHCHHSVDSPEDRSAAEICCTACHKILELFVETSAQPEQETFRRLAHFELVEQLGAGGFGVVWKARDVRLDRVVALKVPRPQHRWSTRISLAFTKSGVRMTRATS